MALIKGKFLLYAGSWFTTSFTNALMFLKCWSQAGEDSNRGVRIGLRTV